jgi:hypothetical protein
MRKLYLFFVGTTLLIGLVLPKGASASTNSNGSMVEFTYYPPPYYYDQYPYYWYPDYYDYDYHPYVTVWSMD